MPTDQLPPPVGSSSETKPRGANRSTKVAGKLKVLPEQPDPAPRNLDLPGPPKSGDKGGNVSGGGATTGDSDEGDIDEDEEEEEGQDAEVCVRFLWCIGD